MDLKNKEALNAVLARSLFLRNKSDRLIALSDVLILQSIKTIIQMQKLSEHRGESPRELHR